MLTTLASPQLPRAFPEPPQATTQAIVAENGPSTQAALAKERVQEIYATLKQEGFITGQGKFSLSPVMINGRPVVALIVGDYHSAKGEKQSAELITKLKERFQVKTVFLEGSATDAEMEKRVQPQLAKFENDMRALCLTNEEKSAVGVRENEVDYKTVNYRNLGFEQEIGLEGKDGEKFFNFALFNYHRRAVEIIRAGLRRGENVCVKIDGKFVEEGKAFFVVAQTELEKAYGKEFPSFDFGKLRRATLSKTPDGKSHEAHVLTPQDLPAFEEYMKLHDKFFAEHAIDQRNQQAARIIKESLQGVKEDILLVVIGLAHTVSTPDTVPSLQDRLDPLGISSASVMHEKYSFGVDKNSRLVFISREK